MLKRDILTFLIYLSIYFKYIFVILLYNPLFIIYFIFKSFILKKTYLL